MWISECVSLGSRLAWAAILGVNRKLALGILHCILSICRVFGTGLSGCGVPRRCPPFQSPLLLVVTLRLWCHLAFSQAGV